MAHRFTQIAGYGFKALVQLILNTFCGRSQPVCEHLQSLDRGGAAGLTIAIQRDCGHFLFGLFEFSLTVFF